MAGGGLTVATEAELEAIRASDPDPVGLMDVMELIAPGARVTGWERMPGGLGNAMHRIDVTTPSGARTGFVLRRLMPEVGQDATWATREAATLEGLRGSLVHAPEVLWLDADGVVFGRPAMAMTILPGRSRSHEAASDLEVAAGLADALVGLRWAPLDRLDHLDVVADPTALVAPLHARRDQGRLPASTVVDVEVVVGAVLAAVDTVAAEEPSLVHGDFHVGNVLYDGRHPTGIVDWDHAHVADPRSDLAYAAMDLHLLAGPDAADAFLAAHAELRGPLADAAWWRLWAATRALPDPGWWTPGWRALGASVSEDQVIARFRTWVDAALAELGA